MEKFYSCYRDGLDGGKDMRFLASFYFLLRILVFVAIAVQTEVFLLSNTHLLWGLPINCYCMPIQGTCYEQRGYACAYYYVTS